MPTPASLIQAFKAAFEAEFGGQVVGGLFLDSVPRGAPMPNATLTNFGAIEPPSPVDRTYVMTMTVRSGSALTAWGLAEQIVKHFTDNPDRPRMAWTGADGEAELEAGERAYMMDMGLEQAVTTEGQWIRRCDVQFEIYSLIQ